MSDKKKDQFADSTFRKKWDSEYYAQRAKDREEGKLVDDDDDGDNSTSKKKHRFESNNTIDKPLGFFKARDEDLNLSSKIGKSSIIQGVTPTNKQGGFYCDVCDVSFKDSNSMLDHTNSKRHNRLKLGVSMRVETSTLEQVQNKLKKGIQDKLMSKSKSKVNTEKELELKREEEYEKVIKNIKDKEDKEKPKEQLEKEKLEKEEKEKLEKEKLEKEKIEKQEKEKEKEKPKVEYEEDEYDYASFGLPTNFGTSKKSK